LGVLIQRLAIPRNPPLSRIIDLSSLFESVHDLPVLTPLSHIHISAEEVNKKDLLMDETSELGIPTATQAYYQPAFDSQKLIRRYQHSQPPDNARMPPHTRIG
jgi:hypothetical protein